MCKSKPPSCFPTLRFWFASDISYSSHGLSSSPLRGIPPHIANPPASPPCFQTPSGFAELACYGLLLTHSLTHSLTDLPEAEFLPRLFPASGSLLRIITETDSFCPCRASLKLFSCYWEKPHLLFHAQEALLDQAWIPSVFLNFS